MYVLALATDYDGTLADHGTVSEEAYRALERLKETGRKLIMVTGRELPDLKRVFPGLDIFDMVVAENGALLYTPVDEEGAGAGARRRPRISSPDASRRRLAAVGRAHGRRRLGAAARRSRWN